MLRVIAGLERPGAGLVRIGGRVVNDLSPRDRDVAMVFQNYALYPHMTVFKNMAFGLKMRRMAKSEIRQKVQAAAEMLEIAHLLDRRPHELSGGEQQRVALGRAIVREPQVFLLDEPLSNLDARQRVRMRTELKELQRRVGVTAIHVTHDQEEAMTLGDRIVVMHRGVVQQIGDPMEVYRRPRNRFVAEFIGSPSMNFIRGRIERNGQTASFVGPAGSLELPSSLRTTVQEQAGRDVILGIRPQYVSVGAGLEASAGQSKTPRTARLGTARVRLTEPLGETVNVHLQLHPGGDAMVARVSPPAKVSTGDAVEVCIDPAEVHIFADDLAGARLG